MKGVLMLLLGCFLAVTGESASPRPSPLLYHHTCAPEFLRLGNGCYFFSKDMATWSNAHFLCKERGGELAKVESPWEDLVIRRHLNRPAMTRLNRWLGGIYDWEQKQWVWGSSGELVGYKGFLAHHKDPYSPRWKCTYSSPSLYYRWNYTKCTRTMHFICEAPFILKPREI